VAKNRRRRVGEGQYLGRPPKLNAKDGIMIRKLWRLLPVAIRDRSWRFLALNKEMAFRLRGSSAFALVRERENKRVRVDILDPLHAPHSFGCVVPADNLFLLSEVFAKRYCVTFFSEIDAHFAQRQYAKPLIVDAGANVGIFTKLSHAAFGHYGTHTLAFEPLSRNLDLLRENLAELGSAVEIVELALGTKPETNKRMIIISATGATINETEARLYLESVGATAPPETSVDVTTVDLHVKSEDGQVALMKMDVEGSEEAIIEGAAATIARDRPAIIYCYEHLVNDAAKTEAFLNTLAPYRGIDHPRTKTKLFLPV